MKTNFVKIAFASCIAAFALVSCDSSVNQNREERAEEKLKHEEVSSIEVKEKPQVDRNAEYKKYKTESEARLAENDNKIAELKAKIKSDRKKVKKEYKKAVAELEKRNEVMKARMREAGNDIKEDWQTFKYKFNEDMDELGKSISSIGEKTKKKS